MYKQTFFFYDLETSGLNSREDRIMQFAGQRTDLNLNPIGDSVNLLVKMNDDTLPSPSAIAVTKITPQSTVRDGLSEAEFSRYLQEEIFIPGTISLGYNSIRFDDEFMRHLFWRNFYDPYEWQWRDGRGRWDLLDAVRMTRALRPDGIKWPVEADGKMTNRLELITKENNISHESAHDALSDVTALIDVTRLIKERQPQLYNYLFKMREKREVKKLVDLKKPCPIVYTSGHYGVVHSHTTVVYPICPTKNGNVLVFDLRQNLDEILNCPDDKKADINSGYFNPETYFPVVKELCYNKCPAVAPLGVLDQNNSWEKINLSPEVVDKNLKSLLSHPEFIDKMMTIEDARPSYDTPIDPESALYASFVPEVDRIRCNAVRNADADGLADFHPNFTDERLPELLLHYKAKNFPTSLSADETKKWETYRRARLERFSPTFVKEIEELEKNHADQFIIDELKLWYESLSESDY